MKGYVTSIERETLENNDYRRVLYTTERTQLVLMSIAVGQEIGEEVHQLDQFIRIEEGQGRVILDGQQHVVQDGSAVVIPAGTKHNVINTGKTKALKLYTIYAPPEHKPGTIHRTKAEADTGEAHAH